MSKIIASTSSLVSVTRSAFVTIPTLRGWLETGLALAIFLCVAGYIGLQADLFKLQWTDAWLQFAIIALVTLIVPALVEELVFRVVIPEMTGGKVRSEVMALTLFALWHPVQVWLHLPMAQPLFEQPEFIAIVALMGACCAVLRRRTHSLWPAVLFHWITVLAWKGATLPS
jgi:predicted Abi (CAAX) family protease